MAFSCNPDVLIADEPTTALDVTVQAQVLNLLRERARARGASVMFNTHELAVVGQLCDRV
jgi:peptide/nickel transport system ATP-binding protein